MDRSRALNHSQICGVRSVKAQLGFVSAAVEAQLFHCYIDMVCLLIAELKCFFGCIKKTSISTAAGKGIKKMYLQYLDATALAVSGQN